MNSNALSKRSSGIIKWILAVVPAIILCNAASTAQSLSAPAPISSTRSSDLDSTLFYPDSIVYFFNTHIIPKADNEPIHPLLFRVKLPPGLLATYTSGFDAFGFQYSAKQMIYVYLDHAGSPSDSIHRVTREEEIEPLLWDDLSLLNYRDELSLENNPFDRQKETWIIKKGKATILLYNIDKRLLDHFLDYTSSFAFLLP